MAGKKQQQRSGPGKRRKVEEAGDEGAAVGADGAGAGAGADADADADAVRLTRAGTASTQFLTRAQAVRAGEAGAAGELERWCRGLSGDGVGAALVDGSAAGEAWAELSAAVAAWGGQGAAAVGKAGAAALGSAATCAVAALSWALEASKKSSKKGSRKAVAASASALGSLPESLFCCVRALHDELFSLDSSEGVEVHRKICKACELWWVSGLGGRESVAAHALPMSLVFSLGEDAKKADVRRVFLVRKMLYEFDLEDDMSVELKHLLLRCFLSVHYLESEEGVKFLAELCWLNCEFVSEIHATIKAQLPLAAAAAAGGVAGEDGNMVARYADVYFAAWRGAFQARELAQDAEGESAAGALVERIEVDMVQDLMDAAVHTASEELSRAVGKVLDRAFHDNKHVKGVDAMLLRLYNPILWRSLSVANPAVRLNAARVLARAFPLSDPGAPVSETDALLQKQFSAFETLLQDASPSVRVAAVQGACRMLSVYWELLPQRATAGLLSTLVGDVLHDTSSAQCRAAVLKGLEFIAANPLARNALKEVLPHVGPLIHDRSRAVRLALTSLLLRVKSFRDVRFFEVVAVEHLLERLACDRQLGGRLTKLLLESFFPQGVGGSEQLERALALAEGHPRAALRFFENVHKHLSAGPVCKLAMLLGKWVCSEVAAKAGGPEDERLFLTALQGIAVLWASVGAALRTKRYASARKQMVGVFSFAAFVRPVLAADGVDRDLVLPPLLEIVAQLPVDVQFERQVLDELRGFALTVRLDDLAALPHKTKAAELRRMSAALGPALHCLCFWGGDELLVGAVLDSLQRYSHEGEGSGSGSGGGLEKEKGKRRKASKKPTASAAAAATMDPLVALWCVQYLLANDPNGAREKLLADADALDRLAAMPKLQANPFGFETLLKLELYKERATKQQQGSLLEEERDNVAGAHGSQKLPSGLGKLFQHCQDLFAGQHHQDDNEQDQEQDQDQDQANTKAKTKTKRKTSQKTEVDPALAALMLVAISDAAAVGVVQLGPDLQQKCFKLAAHCPAPVHKRFKQRFPADQQASSLVV